MQITLGVLFIVSNLYFNPSSTGCTLLTKEDKTRVEYDMYSCARCDAFLPSDSEPTSHKLEDAKNSCWRRKAAEGPVAYCGEGHPIDLWRMTSALSKALVTADPVPSQPSRETDRSERCYVCEKGRSENGTPTLLINSICKGCVAGEVRVQTLIQVVAFCSRSTIHLQAF